jgi:hypothetical protein
VNEEVCVNVLVAEAVVEKVAELVADLVDVVGAEIVQVFVEEFEAKVEVEVCVDVLEVALMDDIEAEKMAVVVGSVEEEKVVNGVAVGVCAIVLAAALVDETEEVVVDESVAEEVMVGKRMVEVAVGICANVLAAVLVDETEEVVVDESEEGEEEVVDELDGEEEVIMVEKRMVGVAVKVYAIALVEELADVGKAVMMFGIVDEMVVEVCVDALEEKINVATVVLKMMVE